MRQKTKSHKRTEVRVEAEQWRTPTGPTPWEVRVYDSAGLLAKTECVSRNNVASKATEAAALALDVPAGRIKVTRVEYA